MKQIKFNVPLSLRNSVKNVKKFLDSGNPLHGPGVNMLVFSRFLKIDVFV